MSETDDGSIGIPALLIWELEETMAFNVWMG